MAVPLGQVTARFPLKLAFLFQPKRFKVLYGGRAGIKSWNIAQALLVQGSNKKLRILCTRATQQSIADSVHALLCDWIRRLGLTHFYRIQLNTIIGANGTQFIFAGLKEIDSIKSLEGVDICWVEEAQNVPKKSWEKLIPTIRKPGSEIWVSFNPELETDDTYIRFVLNTPSNAIVARTTYRDNPWFEETSLRPDMEDLRERDYQAYLNVWEGETKSTVEGAVYHDEMLLLEKAGRITDVAVDRLRPVDTFWDLGFADRMAIWFAQPLETGQIRVVDYLESKGKALEWYLIQIQQRGYLMGTDWLPHDGVDAIIHHRLSGDRSRSPEQLMRAAGRNVRVAAKLHVNSGINAVRTILPNCYIDRDRCSDGLRALRSYQWGPPSAGGLERREPLHDWASHGADAFRTLAVCVRYPQATLAPTPTRPSRRNKSGTGWMGM